MEHPMMKCGHAANAVHTKDGKQSPCCVICLCYEVGETPALEGRTACCYYSGCTAERPSSPDLAFFESKPTQPHDIYYCGCKGWD